uniref:Uncharacterized protein n=1 Tax=Elizabethkingia anophelis TaxID=1117645 RepID=A0A455ZCB8_9FLAO|nr:TPA_exp: hypothetical protein [Elizabethkingia anophelis]
MEAILKYSLACRYQIQFINKLKNKRNEKYNIINRSSRYGYYSSIMQSVIH